MLGLPSLRRRGCAVRKSTPVAVERLESRQLLSSSVITRLELVNADTGKDILNLHGGITLNLATLPTKHLNVRADTLDGTNSVKFGFDGNSNYRVDSSWPFSFAGDSGAGHYNSWTPTVGKHTLTGTSYALLNAAGVAGGGITVIFNITNVAPPVTLAGKPPVAGNWLMKFDDEFNAPLSSSRWVQTLWGTHSVPGDAEIYDPSAVSVSGGLLKLTARKQTLGGRNYVSGMINTGGIPGQTKPGFSFKYGYVEARMKVPVGKGLWSAFWMLPTSNPDGTFHDGDGEIDIAEIIGNAPTSLTGFVHKKTTGSRGTDYYAVPDLTAGFHTYGVDWESDHVTWYLDGKALYSLTDPAAVPQVAEYLILNLTVGTPTSWPGAPTSSTVFPSSMQVDWIHVWQKS